MNFELNPKQFTDPVWNLLQDAKMVASQRNHAEILPEHLGLSIIKSKEKGFVAFWNYLGIHYSEKKWSDLLASRAEVKLHNLPNDTQVDPDLSDTLEQLLIDIQNNTTSETNGYVDEIEVLSGLLKNTDLFLDFPIKEILDNLPELRVSQKLYLSNGMEMLGKYGVDMNKLVLKTRNEAVLGRDEEIQILIQILLRKNKANPLLVGDPGVGKTTLVEELARRIVNKNVPEKLLDKRIISLEVASLLAGTRYRGDFEERLDKILKEIKNKSNIILFIDEFHTIIGAGGGDGAIDAANILKPALARGGVNIIGATTSKEFSTIESDPAFNRRFQKIFIREPDYKETLGILNKLRKKYELHHGVVIQESALEAATNLSVEFLPNQRLPDKVLDVLDEACSFTRLEIDNYPLKIRHLAAQESSLEAELMNQRNHQINGNFDQKLQYIDNQLNQIQDQKKHLEDEWQKSQATLLQLQNIRANIEQHQTELTVAEATKNIETVAYLKYVKLPELKKDEKKLELDLSKISVISQDVNRASIAKIISDKTSAKVEELTLTLEERVVKFEQEWNQALGIHEELKVQISQTLKRWSITDPIWTDSCQILLLSGPPFAGQSEIAEILSRTWRLRYYYHHYGIQEDSDVKNIVKECFTKYQNLVWMSFQDSSKNLEGVLYFIQKYSAKNDKIFYKPTFLLTTDDVYGGSNLGQFAVNLHMKNLTEKDFKKYLQILIINKFIDLGLSVDEVKFESEAWQNVYEYFSDGDNLWLKNIRKYFNYQIAPKIEKLAITKQYRQVSFVYDDETGLDVVGQL